MNKLNKMIKYGKGSLVFIVLFAAVFAASSVSASAMNRKFGIFVGISDYPGMDNDLPGAVSDAKSMQNLLTTKFRFLPSNTKLLLDGQATRDAIFAAINGFGVQAGSGDLLVFHYSGHGSLFPDAYSLVLDETAKIEVNLGPDYQLPLDYYDSTIVPWDSALRTSERPWKNLILDDELYEVFSKITKKGATVVFISDSCHSGSISKAPASKARVRFMRPEKALDVPNAAQMELKKPANQQRIDSRNMYGSYIALAAARDDQAAIDLTDRRTGRSFGLFTNTLIEIIKTSKVPLTYERLMALVSANVSQFASRELEADQHPQLDKRFGKTDIPLFSPIMAAN